ncbi:hypothetical protein Hdeb2414_s0228g00840671 [Helianthus debilis subsp. tardiflorus]
MKVQHIFPVHIQMEDQEDEYFDRLWLETKERSKKVKASAAMNKHVPHTGRGGWDLIEKKKHIILPQLESVYKEIKSIQNSRSKLYLAGRAIYNKETQLYELEDDAYLEARNLLEKEQEMMADGSCYKNKSDPLVQVLGPEHPGRA